MGIVLERSGMAEDLLDTVGQLFGPIRGGLAYAVILVGALLAATTGVVAASVIAMGLISLPIMLRYGYDRPSPPASSRRRARWRRSSRRRWC
jgi:TRAP-type mannitol/chloroaromatic compound transport system permease large subunit